MSYYGIDLGTSNCLVAKVIEDLDGTFAVSCLTDDDGNESFPSVVHFEDSKKYMVGQVALNHLYDDCESTIELIKVRLGKADLIKILTQNEVFSKSPQEISSYILSHLNLLHNKEIDNVVITVPAFFDQSQKNATMQAAIIAEMSPKLLIEEPTAAIMFHIFSEYAQNGFDFFENKEEKNILVFDFGGGTLDLSLINMKKENDEVVPKVLAIGGDVTLGGNIIDFIFTRLVLQKLKIKYNDEFICEVLSAYEDYYENYITDNTLHFSGNVRDEVKQFIFRLKRNLERVKIKLSSNDKVQIVFEGKYQPISISRESFEEYVLAGDELNIRQRIKDALLEISKKRFPVNEVLLIGGSSQIPFIKEIIIEVFEEMRIDENHIILSNDFEQAVAKGAAIQSAIAYGMAIPPFKYNKCESIVARDIELEHAGKYKILVPMGTEYPFKEKTQFSLKIGHALSETVSFKLNEIFFKNGVFERKEVSRFEFYLPIYYTNDDITIHMNIDEAGLYQIEAIHQSTQESAEFESHKGFALSDKHMKTIIDDIKMMADIS